LNNKLLPLPLPHPFNGLCTRTTWVSRYQKGKTSVDLDEARDDGVLTWHLGCSGISWTICKQSAPHTSGGWAGALAGKQTDCLHCLLLVLMTVSNKVWLARTTDRHTHTQADRQIHRQTDRDIHIDRQRDRHIHTNRQTYRQRYTQTERQTDIHTEIQTYRHTDRQLTLSRAGDDGGELLRLSVTESGVPGRQERNGFRRVGQ